MWYPGRRAELEALLDELFASSLNRTGHSVLPRPLAFVVPHAGLVYSGTVAASAYRCMGAAKPDRVFILGFSHSGDGPGVSIPAIGAYRTPLGEVPVDQSAAQELASGGHFVIVDENEVCDHSVENQLPLLQWSVPGTPVVPLYVEHLGAARRRAAAQTLAAILRPGDVLLASSDLTHYGRAFGYQPFPADGDVSRNLARLDSCALDAAGSLDARLFLDTLREHGSTVCGYEPIALLLETLGFMGTDDVFQETLDYQTSGDLTGDFENSVSYGSLGYFRADSFGLDAETREALLASARATLRSLCATGERKATRAMGTSPSLMRRASVFVSLHQGGDLFGCIGTRAAKLPLAEAVPEMALAAALDDPRFEPRDSVPEGLDIEVSVLTPMKRIRDYKSFRIGRDGAYIECKGRSGLLLPQVASPDICTESRFLASLCRKAGLGPEAYLDPEARLSVFRAQVFHCRANDETAS